MLKIEYKCLRNCKKWTNDHVGKMIKKFLAPWVNLQNLCLDVLNTGIQETVENKPVFDPDFHTELIIKDEFEDLDSGNLELGKYKN